MWLHQPEVHRLAVIYASYLVIGYRNQRIPLAGFHLDYELHDLVRADERSIPVGRACRGYSLSCGAAERRVLGFVGLP